MNRRNRIVWAFSIVPAFAFATTLAGSAAAVGEKVDGFPNWAERVHLQLANRARVEPQVEMAACGTNCAEAACYSAKPPLRYERKLGRAARFHADEMSKQGYFSHTSKCTVVSNIDSLYPSSCAGEATCACVGGTAQCSPTCTSAQARVGLFNNSYQGEIIASGSDPRAAFYLWLYENAGGDDTCQFTMANGHRWLILTASAAVGFGVSGYHVGDFGGGGEAHRIPSGSHYPRSGASVDVWANWNDTAGPKTAMVNVDGACTPMTLQRGVATNGTYHVALSGMGSGCHRYFFVFTDAQDAIVTYPTTGSLGIGPSASCDDWNTDRPATGPSCSCTPACAGKQCGDDGCGGLCGNCGAGTACQGGQCVSTQPDAGTGGTGGSSTGGSGGTGAAGGAAGAAGTGGATGGAAGAAGTGGATGGTGGGGGTPGMGGAGGSTAGSGGGTAGTGGPAGGSGGGTGGSLSDGGAADADPGWYDSGDPDACACRSGGSPAPGGTGLLGLGVALAFALRRRRNR